VAAHLGGRRRLAGAGQPLEPGELVALELPSAAVDGQELVTHVLAIDRFGNLTLDAEHEQLVGWRLRLGEHVVVGIDGEEHDAQHARTFTDVEPGALMLYEDAYRHARARGQPRLGADRMAVGLDDELRIRRP
jgi:S-adenosylmethionine hydrolase